MLMRYHYGLGVGHTYSHSSSSSRYGQRPAAEPQDAGTYNSDSELVENEDHNVAGKIATNILADHDSTETGSGPAECSDEESESETCSEDSSNSNGQHEESGGNTSDEDLLATDEMYGLE
jgi:hypothetical protein